MSDTLTKRNEALCRAMPVSRMVDYGLDRAYALDIHTSIKTGTLWEETLVNLATRARSAGHYYQAAMAMNFAQMASNFDTAERMALFSTSIDDFSKWAKNADCGITQFKIDHAEGHLFGWDFHPDNVKNAPTVIVIGGMSGWAISFVQVAQALNSKGLRCLLLDGPGQGETRIKGGLCLQSSFPAAIAAVIKALNATGTSSIGIWGNSMGGLFAAISAEANSEIMACCINGAPTQLIDPDFRTAREQMAAMCGVHDVKSPDAAQKVAHTFASLTFNGAQKALPCPVLICQGGTDPLVPMGSQEAFLIGNNDPRSRVLSWQDGEHTIYNHGTDRNTKVSNWFADVLRT